VEFQRGKHFALYDCARRAWQHCARRDGDGNDQSDADYHSWCQHPGTVQALACDYDSDVKARQVCAKIDPRPYQATLDQYSGQLLRDQAILDKDRADLARLRRHAAGHPFKRQQVAHQSLFVSRDEGTVKLDQALVDSAKLNLGYTDVVAPADGTVVSRNVSEGQPWLRIRRRCF
jgi:multidrug efflux pump subunit AcrA (membrane-fusion protein)